MQSKVFVAISTLAIFLNVSSAARSDSDPIYRVGHGVTAPRPLNRPNPEYSEEARRAGLQGKCVLSLVVNREGKPENVTVSRSLGMGLDEKSIEAVRNWTFEPARKDGKPVAVRVHVVMTFRLGVKPDRATLKRLRKADAEAHRIQWERVYRVEGDSPAPLCHSTQQRDEDEVAQLSLGLNADPRQYELESITFTDNKPLTNAADLRALFPIKDGEPFDKRKVADGLQELKKVYGSMGFVSFKASVDPEIDNLHRRIALTIKCEVGRQFYVDHINMAGLDEETFQELRNGLYVKPGERYNERLANLWLEKNSALIAPDNSIRDRIKLDVNERVGTLVLTYDFTRCAD